MERIHEILLKRNMPHVATLNGGNFEELDTDAPLDAKELVQGLAELNKNGIVLLDIRAGVSREGITKIADVSKAGLFVGDKWIVEPGVGDVILPESTIIPFKSDSWSLGEFILGKPIPKRFLRSQNLLDKFVGEDDLLKKLLVLDPEKRSYTWEIVPPEKPSPDGCLIM